MPAKRPERPTQNLRQWRKTAYAHRRFAIPSGIYGKICPSTWVATSRSSRGIFFGDFVGGVQCLFGTVDRGHFQHDIRLNVIGRYAFAVEEHGAEFELRLGVALQRGLFEVAQGLIEVARRVFLPS